MLPPGFMFKRKSSAHFPELGRVCELIDGKLLHKSLARRKHPINVSLHYYYLASENLLN